MSKTLSPFASVCSAGSVPTGDVPAARGYPRVPRDNVLLLCSQGKLRVCFAGTPDPEVAVQQAGGEPCVLLEAGCWVLGAGCWAGRVLLASLRFSRLQFLAKQVLARHSTGCSGSLLTPCDLK